MFYPNLGFLVNVNKVTYPIIYAIAMPTFYLRIILNMIMVLKLIMIITLPLRTILN